MSDTWHPIIYNLDLRHREMRDEVYFGHFDFDHLAPNLARLPWGQIPNVATPSFYNPSWWWR